VGKSGVESEVKLRVADAAEARRLVLGLGATLRRARHFEDNVIFDDAAGSLRTWGTVLRVRHTGADGVLTYKGPRELVEGVKSREEIETTLGDPSAAEGVLRALGYRPVFRYQKHREVYVHGEVEIVVDETPIGVFLEVEGAVAAVHEAAAALGFAPDDYIAESYAALWSASGRTGDMTFP
jgi:adenylate cyclase, class 2